MKTVILLLVLCLLCASLHFGRSDRSSSSLSASALDQTHAQYRLPVVFVYTVVPASCPFGLPAYIRTSIEQALFTQPDCAVVLLSNLGECAKIAESVQDLTPALLLVDSVPLTSARTRDFHNMSSTIFESQSFNGELWVTSALRFFLLEDLMLRHNLSEVMHVEADNMIYGRFTSILPILRASYPLTATPLNAPKTFITASVFWVSSVATMKHFNDFLLELGSNAHKRWDGYIDWIRPHACCKRGGLYPDEHGNGLKPFAINEMSMLAFYHHLYPREFRLLPVVPAHEYVLNRHVVNMSRYQPNGDEVGPATGHGVWDANSWGQFIGGTSSRRGRDKGFTDSSHISGQAIRTSRCTVSHHCPNITEFEYGFTATQHIRRDNARCYSAPFVRCGEQQHWTPLWNLHVHSKHTADYKSELCTCPTIP